jgi:hypothetical protein
MPQDLNQAKEFVAGVDLSGLPRGIVAQDATADTGEVFDQAKKQAQVIGSGMFSFAVGVTAQVREAISDSALLAQLVANKATSAQDNPTKWFDEYSGCLQNLGWTLQESGWSDYSNAGNTAEVHQQISTVLSAVLGPGAAALSIITASINALKAMKPDSPWLTIFSRESQKAKIARFQVGLVEKEEGSDVFVNLLACLIEAENNVTQVLFFKFKQARASFRANNVKVSINHQALMELGPAIRRKTRAYQLDYVSGVLDV